MKNSKDKGPSGQTTQLGKRRPVNNRDSKLGSSYARIVAVGSKIVDDDCVASTSGVGNNAGGGANDGRGARGGGGVGTGKNVRRGGVRHGSGGSVRLAARQGGGTAQDGGGGVGSGCMVDGRGVVDRNDCEALGVGTCVGIGPPTKVDHIASSMICRVPTLDVVRVIRQNGLVTTFRPSAVQKLVDRGILLNRAVLDRCVKKARKS